MKRILWNCINSANLPARLGILGWVCLALVPAPCTAQPATDPDLSLTVTRTNHSVLLSWFASNSVPYQLESSTNFATWTASSTVLLGGGDFLIVTHPMKDGGNAYFRVKRLLLSQAITASFDPITGILSILGSDEDDIIVVSRDVAGTLRVNDGAVSITGGVPTVANTARIDILGQDGDDVLALEESRGGLPAALLDGGAGRDMLTGGLGVDMLLGGTGDDVLWGRGGSDLLFGGEDNDTLIGGEAFDQCFGEGGDDRFIWNPGDDTDLNEGGLDADTVEVHGGGGDEAFAITANGTRVRFDRLNPAPFALDIGTCEKIELHAHGGNDTLACTGNLAALIQITADGGPGDDTLLGGNGADMLLGGDGNDFMDGQQGNDTVLLGAGDDTFQWDPGDGSDTVEGQAGTDTLLFNGSGGAEILEASANGGRARFTRNLGNVIMDLDDVELLRLNTLANTDIVIVNDLAGTDLTGVHVDLAGVLGGTAGDAAADTVIVNGGNGNDTIDVVGSGASFSVTGLPALVSVANSEGGNDSLVINALGGNDGVSATTLPAGVVKLTLDGGAGDDSLLGSQGADVFLGGAGRDLILGDGGNDLALMGADEDVFQWEPGDGSDTVEGQDGGDTLLFLGANVDEHIEVFANAGRVGFSRNIDGVLMDLDEIESIGLRPLGGVDTIVAGELGGTDLTTLNLDLSGPDGGGDAAADTITILGTQGADTILATGHAGGIEVAGPSTSVQILFQEAAIDRLTLNALAGDDVVDASLLEADAIQLTVNSGLGNDVILGSQGNDLVQGGDGNDLALLGAGDDTFVWNPGDDGDTLEGQAGLDRLLFNGANVAENIHISPNGGRVLFFRNIATVTMDMDDLETIEFNALGGTDVLVVNDLAGTDLTSIIADLAGAIGGATGDVAADTLFIQGSSTDDIVTVTLPDGQLLVSGLAADVLLDHPDPALDTVHLQGLAGDDVIDASAVGAGGPLLVLDGGPDDDILLGGDGNDTLQGREGNDVLLGGGGFNLLDDSLGENILLQGGGSVTTGIVSVFGDNVADTLTLSLDAGGTILSNGEPIAGATVANTALIRVFGRGGNDVITLDESQGPLPAAMLFGGVGDDTLGGGSGADLLFGGAGNDALLGRGDIDLLFGGADDDLLAGGEGADVAFGEVGHDRFVWNPGDDSDLNEGGSGTDTVEMNGGGGAEVFTTTANGTRVRFDRLSPAPFSVDIGTCEKLVLNANGGNDSFSATGNLAALIGITVDGGPGEDTLLGSNGADVLLGGEGNDFIDGQQGGDAVFLGEGDDTFQWDPGDGSDTVEGQAGVDTLAFNGSGGAEILEASANGARVRFTRNLGTIVMDLDDIEALNLKTLGNTDTLTLHDLTGTDMAAVNVDLAATLGGTTGDAAADGIIINGTASPDTIVLTADAGAVEVSGLAALVRITNAEATLDTLMVNGLGGEDVITTGPGVTALIGVTVNP